MQWSDIAALRFSTPDGSPGILQIELYRPPMFYSEINPQPRKHTLWRQTSDFTGNQASAWRLHYLRFQPGELDKHYEKLLQCDPRLYELTQRPFPSLNSPLFDPTKQFSISPVSLDLRNYQYPQPPAMNEAVPWANYQPNGGMVDFAAAPSNSNYNSNSNSNYQQVLEVGLDANTVEYDPNMTTQSMMPPQPQLYPDLNLNMIGNQTLLMEQHHYNNNSVPPFPGENPASSNYQQALVVGLDAPPYYNTNALDYDANMSNQWMMPPRPQLYPNNLNMIGDQTLLMEQHNLNNNSLPPFPGENSTSANFYFPPWE